jgi:hypothetical protein
MEMNQNNRKLTVVLELCTVLLFTLSFVYLLDDVIQVVSLDGVLEDIVFYAFVFSHLVVFPVSLFGWKQLKLKRFGLYTALASFQIITSLAFTYILMNSQV